MAQSLDDLHSEIKQLAIDKGLLVLDDLPSLSDLPMSLWRGDWKEYLDCAVEVHSPILYLEKWLYDPKTLIDEGISEKKSFYTFSEDSQELEWLYARLEEAIAPWSKYKSEVFAINSIWVKEGIAHYWSHKAEWYSEYSDTLETALEQAGQVEEEQRELISTNAALNFNNYATQLAHHPRFPEATSDAKREYMVLKLFPEIEDSFPEYRAALNIVKRANLIYWWEVEPAEKTGKADRAKQMYAEGETVQNIAAVLKMSEPKVRAAIRDTEI